MLDGVHRRFLSDVIELGGGCCVADVDSVIATERAWNSKSLGNVCGQAVQRDVQSIGLKFRRKETAREVAGQLNSFLDVVHNFVRVVDLSRGPASEFFAKDLCSKGCPGQMLAKTVV